MITRDFEQKVAENQRIIANYWRPYQLRWLNDDSRFKIACKSRQIGLSEVVIYEAIEECLSRPYHNVYLASASLREAKELLRRATIWINVILPAITGLPPQAECKKTELIFGNNSRIQALPAEKIRSRSGTVILDEMAFMLRSKEVWAAIAPATEARADLKVRVISTPYGDSGQYHAIWTNQEGRYNDWSRHEVNVYLAAKEGFPVDPDDLKARYPNSIFEQEFNCQFVTDEDQLFSNALLQSATYEDFEIPERHELFGGVDWASVNDRSVFSSICKPRHGVPHVLKPLEIKPAATQMDFADQEAILIRHIKESPYTRLVTDGAGEGSASSQNLRKEFGSAIHTIKGSQWSQVHDQIPFLKDDLQKGELRLPNDRDLLRDFRSIKKKVLTSRKIKYEAQRDQWGHADSFDATLLAYHALRLSESTASKVTPGAASRARTQNRIML